MKTVSDYYDSYSKDVIPRDAGPSQLRETRAAFYSGAMTMFTMMNDVGDVDDMDEAMKALGAIHDEMEGFQKELEINAAKEVVAKFIVGDE